VGHSFAGTIISEAGNDPKDSALVYVVARAPDAGEDFAALAAKYPKPPASVGVVRKDGFLAERGSLPQRFRRRLQTQRPRLPHGE
jgi:hypothetical protein